MGTKTAVKWTEQRVQQALNTRYMPRAKYIINNLYVFHWESDALFMTASRYFYEVEIKVTAQDFKADFKNKGEKHRILRTGMDDKGRATERPHFFSYAVPFELADKIENTPELRALLPPFAGLLAVHANGEVLCRIQPHRLHSRIYSDAELRLTDKFYYNWIETKYKYNDFAKYISQYRAEMNFIKAEFKALTGVSWAEHKRDIL